MQKRILIVTHDDVLRSTRSTILLSAGYAVSAVATDDEAIQLLACDTFDLVVIGRTSFSLFSALDQRLRERYPHLKLLKIAQPSEFDTLYASRTTASDPASVLEAINLMLGESEGARAVSAPSQPRAN